MNKRTFPRSIYGGCLIFILLLTLENSCSPPKTHGERLYEAACMNCHGENGEGLKKLIPPLAGADFLKEYPKAVPCIIRNGMKGPVLVNETLYAHPMPGNDNLSVVEIYNIMQYINNAWGNEFPTPSLKEVDEQLDDCRVLQPWSLDQ